MKLYKFVLPKEKWTVNPDDPSVACDGLIACAIANTFEEAKGIITKNFAEDGMPTWWIDGEHVKLSVFNLDAPCFIIGASIN